MLRRGDALAPRVKATLIRMYAIDQCVRRQLVVHGRNLEATRAQSDRAKYVLAVKTVLATDRANSARLKRLVRDYGWPDALRFGKRAECAALAIAVHCRDMRLMRLFVATLTRSFAEGRSEAWSYATLIDRFALASGAPQLYGTFLVHDRQGNVTAPRLASTRAATSWRRKWRVLPLSNQIDLYRRKLRLQ